MREIAVIYPCPMSGVDDVGIIREFDSEEIIDVFYYTTSRQDASKINKRDLTLDLEKILNDYQVIILVDSDVTKYVAGLSGGVQKFNAYAHQVDNNIFVPVVNPRKAKVYPLLRRKISQAFTVAYEALAALKAGKPIKTTFEKDYRLLDSEEEIQGALNTCVENKVLILDIETSALYPHDGYILGIGFGWKDHMGYYAPLEYWTDENKTLLVSIIGDPDIMVVCHNISFEMKWFAHHWDLSPLRWKNYHDTMFLHYTFDENSPADLKTLSVKHTDLGNYEDKLNEEKKKLARQMKIKLADFSYAYLPLEILGPYACKDIDATAQVVKKFWYCSKKFQTIYQFLLECAPAMAILELQGGPIDFDAVDTAIENYDEVLVEIEDELFTSPEVEELIRQQGKEFNPRSFLQVRKLLYDIAELPIIKRVDPNDEDSNPSTDASVLEAFADQFPIANKILNHRRATKFRNTYLMNIREKANNDARLRTGFNMARTTSGRLSSSGNINYQNIPRGPTIKRLFRARDGYVILQMDLGTAEVWVAAAESQDTFLMSAFDSKLDFHGYVAKYAFNLDCHPNEVKTLYKDQRQAAKAITFGILYGAQAKKIATEIGTDKATAQKLIDQYFENAYMLESWIKACKNHIETKGWIKSSFGRTRRVPEVYSPNMGVKFHAINSAFNFIIQSAASDMNVAAFSVLIREYINLIKMDQWIPWNLVHDSIVCEVKEHMIDQVLNFMSIIFQEICRDKYPHMKSPIALDFEVGKTWGDLEMYKKVDDWIY